MSDHIVDEIAEFLGDRVTLEREQAIKLHLGTCTECAADVEFARTVQINAIEQQMMHIGAARIVAVASAPESITEIEERHLQNCDSCQTDLEWTNTSVADTPSPSQGDASTVPETERPLARTPKSERFHFRKWGWGLASAAAAIVVALLVLPNDSIDRDRAQSLERIKPLSVSITRGGVAPGSFEELRVLGLERYRDGDYMESATLLRQAADARPRDAELQLYLGSAMALTGDFGAAADHLTECIQHAESARLRDEASWQLANTYLVEGRIDEARDLLRELGSRDGFHAKEAAELGTELDR